MMTKEQLDGLHKIAGEQMNISFVLEDIAKNLSGVGLTKLSEEISRIGDRCMEHSKELGKLAGGILSEELKTSQNHTKVIVESMLAGAELKAREADKIERKNMTVKELKEILKDVSDETPVCWTQDNYNFWSGPKVRLENATLHSKSLGFGMKRYVFSEEESGVKVLVIA